jgi:hypothetical protein
MDLRPHLSTTDPTLPPSLRVLTTTTQHAFPAPTVATLRSRATNPATDRRNDEVWTVASRVGVELRTRRATLPADDPAAGLLSYVSDFSSFWARRDGKPRAEAWEVSNVGALPKPNSRDVAGREGWEVRRAVFTNGAMVAGAAVGVGVASVQEGELSVAVTWQEGVVEGEVVEALVRDLREGLVCLAGTGRVGVVQSVKGEGSRAED